MTMHSARLAVVPSIRTRLMRSYYHWGRAKEEYLPGVFAIGRHGEVKQGNQKPLRLLEARE